MKIEDKIQSLAKQLSTYQASEFTVEEITLIWKSQNTDCMSEDIKLETREKLCSLLDRIRY